MLMLSGGGGIFIQLPYSINRDATEHEHKSSMNRKQHILAALWSSYALNFQNDTISCKDGRCSEKDSSSNTGKQTIYMCSAPTFFIFSFYYMNIINFCQHNDIFMGKGCN